MVDRNCSIQDKSYSCMLHETDDEREFLNSAWDEFKSNQLTDLNIANPCSSDIELPRTATSTVGQVEGYGCSGATSASLSQQPSDPENIYYDLNIQQRTE